MSEYLQQLEAKRQNFLKEYKKFKNTNLIIMGAVVAAVILVMILLLPVNQMASIIVIVALMIGTFAYTKIARARLSNTTYEYIFGYYRDFDNHFFLVKPLINLDVKEKEGLTLEDFSRTDLFDNISNVISRNYLSVESKDLRIIAADTGAHVKDGKKTQLVFYGKLFVLPFNANTEDESLICYVKSEVKKDLPVFASAYKLAEETGRVNYYAKEGKLPAYLTPELRKWIENIKVGVHLADAFVSVQNNQLFVGYSFAEPIMNVPYQKEIKEEDLAPFALEIENLVKLADIVR